mmetsp:Transcript_79192/g.169630  ORF Transcript_79192/g.169630 Transcript_79192/m.169630 type:complete len:227 (-) Transcript_79192:331-1011(-)
MLRGRACTDQKGCLAVAADGTIENPGELAVAERHMRLLCGQRAHHIAKGEEALVDGGGLLELRTLNAALLHPLRTRQVHNIEACVRALHTLRLRGSAGSCLFRGALAPLDPHLEDCVTAARGLVHLRLRVDDVCTGAGESLQHRFRSLAPQPGEPCHSAAVLQAQILTSTGLVIGVQEVVNSLVVDLHSSRLHLVDAGEILGHVHEEAGNEARQQPGVLALLPLVE